MEPVLSGPVKSHRLRSHIWGNMTWGKKAGAWGKGPEGLQERKKQGSPTEDERNSKHHEGS